MKATMLAAGSSPISCGFPPLFAKPKCLYTYLGEEALLKRNILLLNKIGITEIRIVVGYRAYKIERFLKRNNLKAEIVYNEDWKTDAVKSFILAFENLDDDVIFFYADEVLAEKDLIRYIEHPDPLVCMKLTPPWGKGIDEFYRGDVGFAVCKIGEEVLPFASNSYKYYHKYYERYKAQFGNYSMGSGIALNWPITGLFYDTNFKIGYVHIDDRKPDLDFYWETNEYLKSNWVIKIIYKTYWYIFYTIYHPKRAFSIVKDIIKGR